MADEDVPLLRARDYPIGAKGCDPVLRQLVRRLDDLGASQQSVLRSVAALRRDVRELRELLRLVVAAVQEKAGAPSGGTPGAPSQIQGEPRRLRFNVQTVAKTRSARNESEEQHGTPSPCQ